MEGRNKEEGGSKCRIVGGILGERRWREACPRGCTWCVYSPLWGVCAKEEAENVGEGGTWTREGGGVELPGIRVALRKSCKAEDRMPATDKLKHGVRQRCLSRYQSWAFTWGDSDSSILEGAGHVWRAQCPKHKQRLAYSWQGGSTLWIQWE